MNFVNEELQRQIANSSFNCRECKKSHPRSEYHIGKGGYRDLLCRGCRALEERKRFLERRNETIDHYGGKCICCGETKKEFLTFDHPNGGGHKHQAVTGGGSAFVLWLIRNNYPSEYQILCYNCNCSLGYHGYCPHNPTITRPVLNRKHGNSL